MKTILLACISLMVSFAFALGMTKATSLPISTPSQATASKQLKQAFPKAKQEAKILADTTKTDTLKNGLRIHLKSDSTGRNVTFSPDTLQTDSLAKDSTQKKKNMLEAPVEYTASDSMTYYADTKMTRLYGSSKVTYEDMSLEAAVIAMNMDSTLVHAHGVKDSTGVLQGKPVYTQGQENYESEIMSYNFKTKKGFIQNVTTEQGEGFMNSESSKRSQDGTLFLQHCKYTTCDAEHPHFYLSLSRAKVNPGKNAFFGPAYLVVADVPLPLAIPFGFFPFRSKYSSGFIMPTYGDETSRGFYLRDGGYYFAISDKMDLTVLGEVYTKGSWGLNAQSNYKKRYKYSGNVYVNYLNTVEGEKNMPDYTKTTSFKVQWTHRQDPKASMNSSLSASVNFATSSFEHSNLASLYNPLSYTQSTRTSSVSYSRSFPNIGLTIATSANLSQSLQDSTLAVSLPDLNINLSRFYPFRKKKQAGKAKWYEKISMGYTGQINNRIATKEDKFLHSSLIKDWKNGMKHDIPVSATFSILKYINVTPTFKFTDRMYTNKIKQSWDNVNYKVQSDTTYGFYNVYNWNFGLAANTTLYGFYKPWRKLFGDKIIAVRHVLKPTVTLNYAPDFGSSSYGYYDSYVRTDPNGNVSTITYSPYSSGIFGIPSMGKVGSLSMSVSNNVEMKLKSDKDSTGERKVSLIDELGGSLSYNMASPTRKWSDLSTRIRLKLFKNYTFSMAAVFATYAYQFDENGRVVTGDRTEWSYGRFGRFQGMSQNLSYTISNSTFRKKEKTNKAVNNEDEQPEQEGNEEGDTNVDPTLVSTKKEKATNTSNVDEDGYLKFSIPWSFTVSYGISMRENTSGKINPKNMRYPYKFTQTMNFSGNIRLSEGWNINYTSGYDFNYHQLSMTTASLSRDLHCFSMTCSVVLRPFTSYNFSFRAKMSTLADVLKWDKRSSYSSNIDWY